MPMLQTLMGRVSKGLSNLANRRWLRKNTHKPWAIVLGGVAVMLAGLSFPLANRAEEVNHPDLDKGELLTFEVDVTQHLASNAQNNVDPSQDPTLFGRGDTFIVDGSVYPPDSIQPGIAEPNPNAPVIGKYRLHGTFTGNTAEFNEGIAGNSAAPQIIAFATESFSLPNDNTTILTDGIWPNARKSAKRVVLGGTGRFVNVTGEIFETNIGENHDGFCNSRVKFKLRKP
jgi:hypothetical protein